MDTNSVFECLYKNLSSDSRNFILQDEPTSPTTDTSIIKKNTIQIKVQEKKKYWQK